MKIAANHEPEKIARSLNNEVAKPIVIDLIISTVKINRWEDQ